MQLRRLGNRAAAGIASQVSGPVAGEVPRFANQHANLSARNRETVGCRHRLGLDAVLTVKVSGANSVAHAAREHIEVNGLSIAVRLAVRCQSLGLSIFVNILTIAPGTSAPGRHLSGKSCGNGGHDDRDRSVPRPRMASALPASGPRARRGAGWGTMSPLRWAPLRARPRPGPTCVNGQRHRWTASTSIAPQFLTRNHPLSLLIGTEIIPALRKGAGCAPGVATGWAGWHCRVNACCWRRSCRGFGCGSASCRSGVVFAACHAPGR